MVTETELAGRTARCTCGKEQPSTERERLYGFEYRGPGSRAATDTCKQCKYAEVAHDRKRAGEPHISRLVCDDFEPHGAWDYDLYYCGCRGWD